MQDTQRKVHKVEGKVRQIYEEITTRSENVTKKKIERQFEILKTNLK